MILNQEKLVIKQTKGMTDKMFFEALKSEKAETLQHWMGKDDFFCHWYAESEDAIFENLEKAGFNSLMMTLPNEMPRFVVFTILQMKKCKTQMVNKKLNQSVFLNIFNLF